MGVHVGQMGKEAVEENRKAHKKTLLRNVPGDERESTERREHSWKNWAWRVKKK